MLIFSALTGSHPALAADPALPLFLFTVEPWVQLLAWLEEMMGSSFHVVHAHFCHRGLSHSSPKALGAGLLPREMRKLSARLLTGAESSEKLSLLF